MPNIEREFAVERDGEKFNVRFKGPSDAPEEDWQRHAQIEADRFLKQRTETEAEDPIPFRGRVRRFIDQNIPAIGQIGIESVGPAAGALAGGKAGAALGALGGPAAPFTVPAGAILGGMAGGLGAEFLQQETGVSPRSKVGLALSGAAPLAGPVGSAISRAGVRMATRSPLTREATRRVLGERFVTGIEESASRIGPSAPSKSLFGQLDQMNVTIPSSNLVSTMKSTDDFLSKISPNVAEAFPEAKRARALAQDFRDIFNKPDISFEEVRTAASQLGRQVGKAEGEGGLREGSTKLFFKSLMEDLDKVALSPGASRDAVLSWKAAKEAFKKEKSQEFFESLIAKHSKVSTAGGEDVVSVNIGKLLDEINLLTNPKSARFDKNFTAGLGNEKDQIRSFLVKANEELSSVAKSGPGELIVRGRGAKLGEKVFSGVAGGLTAGLLSGNPFIMAIGAMQSTKIPEALGKLLSGGPGRRQLIDKIIRRGERVIDIPLAGARAQAGAQSVEDPLKFLRGAGEVMGPPTRLLGRGVGSLLR